MVLQGFRDFLKRQSHNYRIILLRSAISNFFTNLTQSYNSIYITGLGTDEVTLGFLASLSSVINMCISLPLGWISDRYNLKRVMGIGMIVQLIMIAFYAFANDWTWILVAMIAQPFTQAFIMRSQSIMISKDLQDLDRAQGFGLRQIITQFMGLLSPIPAAFIVLYFGGLTVEGIRPLYFISLIGMIILFVYIYSKLVDVPPVQRENKGSFLQDFREVFKDGKGLMAWVGTSSVQAISIGMTGSFVFLYLKEIKGADALTIGLLSTVETLTMIILSIPMSKIADTRGRRFAVLLSRPARILWLPIVVYLHHPYWLIVAWIFRGISRSSNVLHTWSLELVPPEQRGRWLGIINTINSVFRIPSPIIGGLLYNVNPALIFLIPFALETFIRIPLFAFKVPETLKKPTETKILDHLE
jgi:MFS family permease